jgi:hypothetical protein
MKNNFQEGYFFAARRDLTVKVTARTDNIGTCLAADIEA